MPKGFLDKLKMCLRQKKSQHVLLAASLVIAESHDLGVFSQVFFFLPLMCVCACVCMCAGVITVVAK